MKLKILSVDFPLEGQGIENASFWDAPSFSDYDVVIINPSQISETWTKRIKPEADGSLSTFCALDKGFGNFVNNFFSKRREETSLLLRVTGGILICILKEKGQKLYLSHGNESWSVDKYSWLPSIKLGYYNHNFNSSIFTRKGEHIKLEDKKSSFSQYISGLMDSLIYESIISGEILKIVNTFAVNKVGEVVGGEVPFGKGKIVFLPPLKRIDPPKVSGILIDCIRKSLHWTEPLKKPPWITKYSLAKEKTVKSEIDSLKEREKEIKNLIDEQEKKMFRLEMVKSLLYEQGKHGLEPAVREAFRTLGFNVLEPEEYEEEYDLFIRDGDHIIIGEIEGSIKQVGVTKYRQLLDYADVRVTKGEKVKGILIGNGFLETDPEKRNGQFTDEAIRGCESKRFCRITTCELFKAVKAVIENPEYRDGIKQAIINCDNEYKFDNSLSS